MLGKFPLGVISFVFLVTLLVIPIAFLLTPFVVLFNIGTANIGNWNIDSVPEASIFASAGALLFFPFIHVLNGIAWLHAKWAQICLSR